MLNVENLSTPEERAKRLIKLRNMANLSRQAISQDINCSIETYKSWELARFGGLSLNGAKKVIAKINQENIICTLDWLFYGKGIGPYILPFLGDDKSSDQKADILDEISFFSSKYKNAIFTQIQDDAMSPIYEKSDYIAGIKLEKDAIKDLIGSACIVQTIDGKLLARFLKAGTIENHYTLYSTNINTTSAEPMLINVELVFAAVIIRKYTPL